MSHQAYTYLKKEQWIHEGSPFRVPETITLRDENGVALGSSTMATMLLTLYDTRTDMIINGLDGTVDIKNTRGCTLSSQGVLVFTLGTTDPADTVTILQNPRNPQERTALIQFTWPALPVKSDAIEIHFAVLNIHRRPT